MPHIPGHSTSAVNVRATDPTNVTAGEFGRLAGGGGDIDIEQLFGGISGALSRNLRSETGRLTRAARRRFRRRLGRRGGGAAETFIAYTAGAAGLRNLTDVRSRIMQLIAERKLGQRNLGLQGLQGVQAQRFQRQEGALQREHELELQDFGGPGVLDFVTPFLGIGGSVLDLINRRGRGGAATNTAGRAVE